MIPFELVGGVALGLAVGNNNTTNVFGIAVSSQSMRLLPALVLSCIFIFIGGMTQGFEGMRTLSSLSTQTAATSLSITLACTLAIACMSLMRLSVSASQCIIGAIVAVGIAHSGLKPEGLYKIALSWVSTPMLACLFSVILYVVIGTIVNRLPVTIFTLDRLLKSGLVLAGCYAGFALGANNVAASTAVYAASGLVSPMLAALIGSLSIAFGSLSTRRSQMAGKKLISLDPYSAFIAVLSQALTLHVFALIGVPVSTSQALFGALLGIGLLKGVQTIKLKNLFMVIAGWIVAPLVAGLLAVLFLNLDMLLFSH